MACRQAGISFVNFSLFRSDAMKKLGAEWLTPQPGSNTAIMLGMGPAIFTEGLHDQAFLERYTIGFERFLHRVRPARQRLMFPVNLSR